MLRYQWAKIYCTCRRLANCFALNILRLIVLANLSSFSCKFRWFSKVGGTSKDPRKKERKIPTAKWLRTACGLSVMSVTQDTGPYVNTKQETPGPWNLSYRFRQSGHLYFVSVWLSPIYHEKKTGKNSFSQKAKFSISVLMFRFVTIVTPKLVIVTFQESLWFLSCIYIIPVSDSVTCNKDEWSFI